jgi:hypothetical protein
VKSLNFVDGELSCVGKSLFTCLLIEAYRHFERDYHIVDLVRFNPDVWRRYCRHSDMNGIYFSDDLDELYRTDRLLELVQERDVIINLPARVTRKLNEWLSVNSVLEDYPVYRWFVRTDVITGLYAADILSISSANFAYFTCCSKVGIERSYRTRFLILCELIRSSSIQS